MNENFQAKLIFLLSLIDIIAATASLIPTLYYLFERSNINEIDSSLSYIFGYLRVLSECFEFGLTTIITYTLHMAINENINAVKYQKKLFLMLIFGTLFLSIVPIIIQGINDQSAYGETDMINCWMMNRYSRMFVFFIPWITLTLINLYFILKIRKGLKKEMFCLENNFSRKLLFIPLILFFSYVFNFIRRLCNFRQFPNSSVYDPLGVIYCMFIFMPLLGFFNSLVVGTIDDGVRERLQAFFCCNMEKFYQINRDDLEKRIILEADSSHRFFNDRNSTKDKIIKI